MDVRRGATFITAHVRVTGGLSTSYIITEFGGASIATTAPAPAVDYCRLVGWTSKIHGVSRRSGDDSRTVKRLPQVTAGQGQLSDCRERVYLLPAGSLS